MGRDLAAVETEIGIEGRASGINVVAHGGWLVRFEGDLVAEGVLHQIYEDALLEARRRALADARLYFVCEAQPHGGDPAELLEAAIAGGVDVIQLREKAPRCAEELVAFAEPFARAAQERGALFFLNDEPDLVEACDADGVHVGQDDEPVAAARASRRARRHWSGSRPTRPSSSTPRSARAAPRAPTRSAPGRCGRRRRRRGARRPGSSWSSTRRAWPGPRSRGSRSAASTRPTSPRWSPPGARRIVVVRAIRDAGRPRGRRARAARGARPRRRPLI